MQPFPQQGWHRESNAQSSSRNSGKKTGSSSANDNECFSPIHLNKDDFLYL
jgi:hypothetical protein